MSKNLLFVVLCLIAFSGINARELNNTNTQSKNQIKDNLLTNSFNTYYEKYRYLKSRRKSLEEIYELMKPELKNSAVSGSLSGKITQSDGVSPLNMPLMIDVFDEYGKHVASRYFSFGAVNYFIDGLPEGKYFVLVTADWFYIPTYYKNKHSWQEADLVEVSANSTTADINFEIAHYSGYISGIVTDSKGMPIAECAVAAYSKTRDVITAYSVTDQSGKFLIEGIPSGEYRVFTLYDGNANFTDETADNVFVSDPDTLKNMNFTLRNGAAVEGHVFQPDDKPVGEFSTSIVLYDLEGKAVLYVYNGADNYFMLKGIKQGSYKIRIHNFKNNSYSSVWYGNADKFEDASVITISPPDTLHNIDIKFKNGGSIRGKITGDGASVDYSKTTMIIYNQQGEYINQAEIGETGEYIIEGLISDSYKLQISSEGFRTQWYSDKKSMIEADPVEINAPGELSPVNFIMRKGASISGSVFTPAGTISSASALITAVDLSNKHVATVELKDGNYEFISLEPGSYKLSVNSDEYANEWYNNSSTFTGAEVITVSLSQNASNMNFYLDSSASIQGYLTSNGTRVDASAHNIMLMPYDAVTGIPAELGFGFAYFNGGFNFKTKPGKYKLAAITSYNQDPAGNQNYAVTWYGDGKRFNDPASRVIEVKAGQKVKLEDFGLQSASGSVSGTIFSRPGTQPKNAHYSVYAFEEDGFVAQGSYYTSFAVNTEGKYTVAGLRPGKYYFAAQLYEADLDRVLWKWYGNVPVPTVPYYKAAIPAGAAPVIVADNAVEGIDFIMENSVGISDDPQIYPDNLALEQNFPNPFNPETTIRFSIPAAGYTSLKIYDILGNQVTTLVNKYISAGRYEYTFKAGNLSTGMYIYELRQEKFTERKKMLFLK